MEKHKRKIAKEKQKIAQLRQDLKKKKKGKSFSSKAFKKLKALELEAERVTHPERFTKSGKRRKGKRGR